VNDRGDPGRVDIARKLVAMVFDQADKITFSPLAFRHTKDRLERAEPLGSLSRIAIVCHLPLSSRGWIKFWSIPPLGCRWIGAPDQSTTSSPISFWVGASREVFFVVVRPRHGRKIGDHFTAVSDASRFRAPKLRKTS
jgi:hypothetical protein